MSNSISIDNFKNCIDNEKMYDSVKNAEIYYGIKSVPEYLMLIDLLVTYWKNIKVRKNYKKRFWFRGLKSKNYNLVPTIARSPYTTNDETIFLSKFKSKAIPYLKESHYLDSNPSYWGWLFLMQHYGVPTRLMDWSKDPLVALIFALYDLSGADDKEPAVWVLNPVRLNKAFRFYDFYNEGYIPNAEEKVVYEVFGPDSKCFNLKPCAVYGPMNSSRIIAQKGVFTIFPKRDDIIGMNELPDYREYLFKIIIDKNSREEMIKELMNYGLTYSSLFPELSTIASQIREEEGL